MASTSTSSSRSAHYVVYTDYDTNKIILSNLQFSEANYCNTITINESRIESKQSPVFNEDELIH